MFELCDNLVGIYKTFNCTKSVTINPRVYEDNSKSQPIPATKQTEEQGVGVEKDAPVAQPNGDSTANSSFSEEVTDKSGEIVPDSLEGEEMEVDS